MTTSRPKILLLAAFAATVVSFVLARFRESTGGTPLPVPWSAVVGMLAIALSVLVVAWPVRRWNAGRRDRRLDPLRAARAAVLAKAASHCGALLCGWFLGAALAVAGNLGIEPRRERFVLALVALGVAGGVAAAGLVAERWCRLPQDHDDDDRGAAASLGG